MTQAVGPHRKRSASDARASALAPRGSELGRQQLALCRQSIALHSKSFALASRLLPPTTRDPTAVVYAWCRRADDFIDSTTEHEQRRALDALRLELTSVYAGDTQPESIAAAFQQVTAWHGIPEHYPHELLNGMEMDTLGFRYESLDQLLLYCYRVASTVGLMMCHVMGVSDSVALRHAAHLGMAMQLTNIARDVHEDWLRCRLYLPEELLAKHSVGFLARHVGSAFPRSAVDGCRAVVRELLSLADRYYASGDRGLRYLGPRHALAVSAAREIYSAIGLELAAREFDVLAPRAFVPTYKKLSLCAKVVLRALWHRRRNATRDDPTQPTWARSFQPVPLSTIEYGPDVATL